MPEHPENSKATAAAKLKLTNAYQHVFSSESGKIVLRDLTAHFHYNAPSFRPPEFNSHAAAVHDGERSVITHILQKSNPHPPQYETDS